MSNLKKTSWTLPTEKPDIREDELKAWELAVERVQGIGETKTWTKIEMAKQLTVAEGSFSGWYSGKYGPTTNNITVKINRALDDLEQALILKSQIKKDPGFITTPTSKKVQDTLAFAQRQTQMVVVTMAAGMGKTEAVKQYAKLRPNVHYFVMRPQTRSLHAMMTEVCRVLGVKQNNPAKLDTAIAEVLLRIGHNPLLIFDEAQNMDDLAVNQLRYFLDEYGCGIALVGSLQFYNNNAGLKDPQLSRRIGKRMKELKPLREDITALLNAWEIEEPESRKLLSTIASKDGALGTMVNTIKLASFVAAGSGVEMTTDHIRAAWSNRDGGI